MISRHRLLILTLAMPVLLGWIVLVGELNRRLDRSMGVHARMRAERVDETAFTAPMLKLGDQLLEDRPVPADFRLGEDLFLRFRMREDRWVFETALKKRGAQDWSASVIDIPARAFASDNMRGLQARPLLPRSFAVSRKAMSRIRRETLLDVTLHRGAFGTIWISQAVESAAPLGVVIAILKPPHGNTLVALGELTEGVTPAYGSGREGGWMAPMENGAIGVATEIAEKPLDAIYLPAGIAIATQTGVRQDRFSVSLGDKTTSHEGTFLSFDPDGSFWAFRPDPFPSGKKRKLIHWNLDGTVKQEIVPGDDILAASDDTAIGAIGYEVRRYAIESSKLIPRDSWTVEGLTSTCMATPRLIAAAGSDGVFLLTAGSTSAIKVFDRDHGFPEVTIECGRAGEVLVLMKASRPAQGGTIPARLLFANAGGIRADLGVHELSWDWRERSGMGGKLLQDGKRLYVGRSGEILVFDLDTNRLLHRITGRRLEKPMRVL